MTQPAMHSLVPQFLSPPCSPSLWETVLDRQSLHRTAYDFALYKRFLLSQVFFPLRTFFPLSSLWEMLKIIYFQRIFKVIRTNFWPRCVYLSLKKPAKGKQEKAGASLKGEEAEEAGSGHPQPRRYELTTRAQRG